MKKQEKSRPEIALLHERLEGSLRLVGLTGGIASGKSTVSLLFKESHIPLIDADEIARQVVQPRKEAYRQIVKSFGEGILNVDGSLDRNRLGEIVFGDDAKKKLLESITHPPILKEIAKKVAVFKKKKARVVVIDAALLFESGLSHYTHKNILVRIHPDVQLKRLMERDHFSASDAWQRILSQMPSAEKEKHCDFVIDNSGTPEETRRQVKEIMRQLLSQSYLPRP